MPVDSTTKPHLVSAHFNLLPYHAARYDGFLKQFGDRYRLTSLLLRPTKEYELFQQPHGPESLFGVERLSQETAGDRRPTRTAVHRILTDLKPDVLLLLGGYSEYEMRCVIEYSRAHCLPTILCSESQAIDEPRSAWKEFIKRQIVGCFSAALAGGTPHKDYMVKLGMPAERVFVGYDAVDNGYFANKAEESRKQKAESRKKFGLPGNYFLASARFIEKKNLTRLLEAYALYREKAETLKTENLKAESEKSEVRCQTSGLWSLILLGDGTLRPDLCRLISDLRLQHSVHLPGFKQYDELPAYYGLANVFIHASTTEQWGLVVNEAMASGLPVLVSNRCGCATDLVQEGVNGFTFDPYNVEQLAQLMLRISDFRFPISDFGAASARIIADWGPERFAKGLKAAAECALKAGPKRASLFDRLLLRVLLRR